MMSSRTVSLRKTRWAVAAAVLATALVPLTSQAAGKSGGLPGCDLAPDKCYSFSMSVAGSPGPGDSATYTGTLKNLSPNVQLGSANITWSPSDAFYSVTAGSVSVSPSSSDTPPTEAYNSGTKTIELRDLNAAPGATVTFTFQALALRSVNVTWSSAAKQANNFLGVGNNLAQNNADPTTSVSGNCGGIGSIGYNSYGCAGIPIATGGTVCTGGLDSEGQPSAVTACTTFPPIPGASGIQLMAQRSYLGGEGCPVEGVLDCTYVVQLLNKLNVLYTGAFSASITINCGDLCGTVKVFFQQDESTGTTEPLLPCLPVSPVASPISGSLACYTDNGDGTVTISFVTYLNDYRVMGRDLAIGF